MNNQASTPPAMWALLIGVDCYMDATIAGIPRYGSLSGCVNDIALMDAFLRDRLNVPAQRIKKLTSSGWGIVPQERPEDWPNKANIVAAFKDLAQQAQRGDQVYIHYSGHGGRAVTLWPDVKGAGGLDESLVPTDYGQIENQNQPEDRYVRDVELAALLQVLVDRKLIVTVVLDSCHSGGAARGRGDEEGVRGSFEIDMVPRVASALVGSPKELADRWQEQTRGTRAASVASGWLPDPNGYTLLAACRALELAREYGAPNGKKHGALSYWLWHTLQSPGLNWEMVQQQVLAGVHGTFASQTPQLQGVGNRAVFGGAALALPAGVNILEVQGDRLRLNIGQAGGVGVGAQYFVYRKGVTDFKQTDQRVAVVELTEVMDVESWAKVVRWLGGDVAIEPGAQALLFDPGKGQQRAVRLMRGGEAPGAMAESALADLATALGQSESRFVRVAADGEHAHFQVGITAQGKYEIRDAGGQPLANLQPVPIDDPREAVDQLDHLAKYFNVLELSSPDTMSRLAGKLEVKLMRTQEEPFDEAGGIPTVKDSKQVYYLRIRNLFEPMQGPPSDADWYIEERRRRTMNITVLNLASEWSISRFLPPLGDAEDYYDLEPGETLLLPRTEAPGQTRGLPALASAVPAGATEASDILKVFATTDTASYDSLQLPRIGEVSKRALLVNPQPQQPERTWITTQVMVRAVK
jgi:hypothetical protein